MTFTPPPPPSPPPPQPKPPVQAGKLWLGIGIALIGHLLTIIVGWVFALLDSGASERAFAFLVVAIIAQAVLMIAALIVGIVLAVKGDGGVGVGIIIGWAIGLVISPVVGFGVCVSLLNNGSGLFG